MTAYDCPAYSISSPSEFGAMPDAYISGETFDDVLRSVIEQVQARGSRIHPTKGEALDLTGILLEIANPRSRLSRTESRGKVYSCLGELCWYLARSNDLSFISYYIPTYADAADGDVIVGGTAPAFLAGKTRIR